MLRWLPALLAAWSCLSAAETSSSYARLAATARLWAHVKYLHPGVTDDPTIDWDAAFINAAPKILAANNDAEFVVAANEMLSALHDPSTRVISRADRTAEDNRILPDVRVENGITIVTLKPGSFAAMMQGKAAFAKRLAGSGTVLFDLRGAKMAAYAIPESLPLVKESIGPALMMRVHSGYANDNNTGSGGYKSHWEMQDGVRVAAAVTGGIKAVFLVNHETNLPPVALAAQASGAGAIVSEDQLEESQMIDSSRPFSLTSSRVAVREHVIFYSDGTTGIVANQVLEQTGTTAFKAALAIAKSGDWPPAPPRRKLTLPPARFAEKNYTGLTYPATEYRMLAAARIWGVFNYFHPYRHLYGEDWDAVLAEFLPKMAQAADGREYHKAVAEMVAHVHDTHCFVGSAELTEYFGRAAPPVELRWIENQPVVTRVFDNAIDLKPGDVLVKIEGESYRKRADDLAKHISASTEQSMMSRVTGMLLTGDAESAVRATFRRGDEPEREVSLKRGSSRMFPPDRMADPYRLINPKIGYVDLAKLSNAQVDEMFDDFKNTEAIIMDMRGYPQGTAWSIAPRLAEKQGTVAAHFRRNLVTPDALESSGIMSLMFEQRIPVTTKPRYSGKTVMLIDERAISQSEHSGLFYRAANGTKFIGSPTTGANGDVTFFAVPGGITINFSGHDVRWPDGRQLQRVGLVPDIEVRPTIAGIRAGRDEILERAIAFLETGR